MSANCLFYVIIFSVFQEVQITRVTVMGELELGQDGHQVMCFVTHFLKNEFISSDAMSKLRQVYWQTM